MSERPNFYHLLDLDPDVDDWAVIETRLVEKRREWARDKTTGNPKKRRIATRAVDLLAEMERTLGDPAGRKAEARAEKQRRQAETRAREKELDEALEVLKAAGRCRQEDLDKLVNRFLKSLPEALVRRKIKEAGISPAGEGRKRRELPRERTEGSTARTIRENLDQTGHGDLYDFLGLRPQSSCTVLAEKATEIYRENQRLGKTDAKASAESVLAGLGQQIFRDEKEKAKYDAYLAVAALDSLKPNITLAAADGFISRQELDTLVRQARERGVSAETARAYLEEYAETQKVGIERDADLPSEALRRCGFCGTLASSPKAGKCSGCGEDLELSCPRCGAVNPSAHAACESCGARVGDAPLVLGHLREARRLADGGDLETAEQRLRQALRLWPDWRDAVALLKEVEARRQAFHQQLETIEKSVTARRLLRARRELEGLERRRGPRGLEALRQRIERDLAAAEAAFRQGEEHRRAGRLDPALDAFEKALGLAADHEEARKAMAASPPPAPADLVVRPAGAGFRLTWKPGSRRGSPRYRVMRKAGSAPRDETDGELVGEVRDALLDDTPVAVGEPWHYAVFTLRGGVSSATGARSGPHLRTAEVGQPVAVSGDGSVTLSFEPPPGCARVEVRGESGAPPERAGVGRSVSVTGNSATETGLPNGLRRGYRVVTVFADPARPGREIVTPGVTLEAVPIAPPEPVLDLVAERQGDEILLTWSAVPDATVEIRRTSTPPPFRPGEALPASEAGRFGSIVPSTGAGSARLRLETQGRLYFVPLTARETTVVPGAAREVVTLDPVRDLKARRSGRDALLTWTWPEGGREVLVRVAGDRPPRDPEAGDAVGHRVTRTAYDRSGGFELTLAADRDSHVSAFACAVTGGLHASPATLSLSSKRESTVSYEVQVRRHWLRRRIDEAWVELVSEDAPSLPAVILVGKPGSVPIHPQDGVALERRPAVTFSAGRARIDIPTRHWRSNLYCKLFFDQPEAAGGLRLLPAPRERLRLP